MPETAPFVQTGISSVSPANSGDAVIGSADAGYQTFSVAFSDADRVPVYFYLESPNGDSHDWEHGIAEWDVTSGALLRNDAGYVVIASSNGGSKINLTTTHKCRVSYDSRLGSNIKIEPSTNTICVGPGSGNDTMTGIDNAMFGYQTGQAITTGQENTAVGSHALAAATSGSTNTAVGKDCLQVLTTGGDNCGFGKDCLSKATTSSQNCGFGKDTLYDVTTGYHNNAFGYQALVNVSTGYRNIGIGYGAGAVIDTGRYNICIGHEADANAAGAINRIAIGYKSKCTANNQCVIGSDNSEGGITDFYLGQGVVDVSPAGTTIHATGGSGTDNPGGDLEIAGGAGTGAADGGSVVLKVAPAGSTGSGLNSLVTGLEIDSNKNIVCGTGALATDAVDGFLFIPSCAGTPTGTPTAKSGRIPMVYDSSNNILYAYSNSQWRAV